MHKFYSRIIKDPITQCWNWQGARQNGYGKINGDTWYGFNTVHRWSYHYHKGPIPHGLMVRHMCNNRQCANPDHLEVGTAQDNTDDRMKTDKHLRGETNGNHKLTIDQVLDIRKRYIPGINKSNPGTSRILADQYDISVDTVRHIAGKKLWKHL